MMLMGKKADRPPMAINAHIDCIALPAGGTADQLACRGIMAVTARIVDFIIRCTHRDAGSGASRVGMAGCALAEIIRVTIGGIGLRGQQEKHEHRNDEQAGKK